MIDLPLASLTKDLKQLNISTAAKSSKISASKTSSGNTNVCPISITTSTTIYAIDDLPSELLISIFSYLSLQYLGIVRKVGQKWRYAADKTLDSICRGAKLHSHGLLKPSLAVEIGQESSGMNILYKLSPTDLRDHNWIEFALTDDFLLKGSFGFLGLAAKIADICGPLFSKDAKDYPEEEDDGADEAQKQKDRLNGPLRFFDKQAYSSLNTFLKSGWKSLEESLPANLRPAYGSLFKHILNTFDTLCERPSESMRLDTQLALVTQIWRVVDVLAPKQARDARFETPASLDGAQSFYYDLLIKLERELGLGEPDQRPIEFPAISISPSPHDPNPSSSKITVNWEWNCGEKGKIRCVTCAFSLRGDRFDFPAHFEVTGLQHGENYDFCSVSNVTLRVPKAYLLA